jgi:protein-tyrosine phosphatase
MTDFCQNIQATHVPDPYYGGDQGFENVINLLEDACEGLYKDVISR